MFHHFFDKRPWFSAKRFGYGAGLPIAWQGWVLILSYASLMTGIAMFAANGGAGLSGAKIFGLFAATAVFLCIVFRRTEGGWHWRRGRRD
jgi:drug/metabolite transporter (DMT)-like permease